ncbi:hypothetical protein [Calidifontibacter indicus]|uniref:Uncharacterized protein n=1 Tax=Calidifontibacter indicus TaxID=419650 RepID=A0A3D9UMT7_9MICO|nr:hypothetical protein [Calidifontibacter indicus]REF30639.1 hypothetical protein DFJ65_1654 [Calidifontibacter indicus]
MTDQTPEAEFLQNLTGRTRPGDDQPEPPAPGERSTNPERDAQRTFLRLLVSTEHDSPGWSL